jgi:hypothetical protein
MPTFSWRLSVLWLAFWVSDFAANAFSTLQL